MYLLAERCIRVAGTHCDHVERSCSTTGAMRASRKCSATDAVRITTPSARPPVLPSSFLGLIWPICSTAQSFACSVLRLAARGLHTDGHEPARRLCDRHPRILHDRKVTGPSLAAGGTCRVVMYCRYCMCLALPGSHQALVRLHVFQKCSHRTGVFSVSWPSVYLMPDPSVLSRTSRSICALQWVRFVGINLEHGPHR